MADITNVPMTDLEAAKTPEPVSATAPASLPWPPRKDAYYSLFVMTIVVLFTVIDRQVLSLFIDPIKQDFGINDSGMALLLGAAFSLPYGIFGIPIARLADQGNRRNLVAASVAFWSACTIACGMVQGYFSLLVARMGIGTGESGYGPASWAIISDNWPREKVAFATATQGLGATLGAGLALFLGGVVLHFVSGMPAVHLPLVGLIRPWQWTFIIVGAPGLIWSLVVLTSKEPPRRGLALGQKVVNVPVREVARWLRDDWRSYLATIGSMGVRGVMLAGPMTWNATFLHRQFGWDLSKVGIISGTIALIISPIGLMLGARLSEYWNKRGHNDADLRIVLYCSLATVPLLIAAPLMPDPYLVLGLNAVVGLIGALTFGPSIAAFQVITPNSMRSQVGSLSQFSTNVIAFALGPLLVALSNDYLFRDEHALKYSMVLINTICGIISILLAWQGLKPYARSYARALREFAN